MRWWQCVFNTQCEIDVAGSRAWDSDLPEISIPQCIAHPSTVSGKTVQIHRTLIDEFRTIHLSVEIDLEGAFVAILGLEEGTVPFVAHPWLIKRDTLKSKGFGLRPR